ncbi:MAG: VOC family protein [Variovorax sp.]
MQQPHLSRRAGVLGVHSIDRVVYSVPDLDEAERFYRAFGLDVRRSADRLALLIFGHPQVWAQIHQGGSTKRLGYLSYGVDQADLPAWRERIAEHGLACAAHPLSDGSGLWLRDPDGTALQLLAAPKVSPSAKSSPHAPRDVMPGRGAAPARSAMFPVRPRCLSHVLFFTPDVSRMVEFGEKVLGLRLSDRSADVIAFMHGVHGSDHHLVAFAKSHAPGLHHTSWDVGSFDDIGAGAEQMRIAGYDKGWGVGRHVLGSNYFHYVRDPWGSFAEYSFDIDFVPHTLDWPAADHPLHDSLYVWGPPVPDDFIANHEAPHFEPQSGDTA